MNACLTQYTYHLKIRNETNIQQICLACVWLRAPLDHDSVGVKKYQGVSIANTHDDTSDTF